MRKIIAVSLIPLVALPGPALADGCRRVAAHHAPYHAPYVAPVYHHDFAIVAKAVPVFFPVGGYTSVGQEARTYFDTKEAVRLGTLEALREFQATQGPPVGPSPDPPVVPPLGSPKPIPKGKAASTGIKGILTARCASCHNPKDPDRVDLSGDPEKIPAAVAGYCATQVTKRAMPKKGEMPDNEFDQLVAWADEKMAAALTSKK